ncbi:hypothetical protein GTY20_37925 [Streptomyces sp. SID4946]|nr:hypothetical protein [Streptomyces sp. SID4946]SCG01281.1 hypothetical protein GA0115256_143625 [Streptomyces sp. DconLS]SCG05643.1 hypothetical protein GA0115258_12875 [Streptomyces sp. LamerLS-31b]
MHVPTLQHVRQLTDSDFTKEDVAEFHRLMTALLAACKTTVDHYAVEGVYAPSASGLFEQFGETMQAITEVSRRLNQTRSGIRRIAGRARERLYVCDTRLD